MNVTVILLAGLPGSGKTTYLAQLLKDGWLIFDDFKANAPGNNSHFSKSPKFCYLINALAANLKCVVADIDFCDPESRDQADSVLLAAFPQMQLDWQFFENNLPACEANLRRRNSKSMQDELCSLDKYARSYKIPQGVIPHPVFTNTSQSRGTDSELP